jgi:hypothetical protein
VSVVVLLAGLLSQVGGVAAGCIMLVLALQLAVICSYL